MESDEEPSMRERQALAVQHEEQASQSAATGASFRRWLRDGLVLFGAVAVIGLVWLVREVLLVICCGILLAVFLCDMTKLATRHLRLPRGAALTTILFILASRSIVGLWETG